MPSVIQADQLKSADGNTTYLNSGTLSNITFPSGIIIKAESFINSTRGVIPLSTSTDREIIDFGDYNKQESSSTLLFHIFVPAYKPNQGGAVSIGVKYGSAGTIWGGAFFPELKQLRGDAGGRQVLQDHLVAHNPVEISSPAIFSDIDTPADLQAVRNGTILSGTFTPGQNLA